MRSLFNVRVVAAASLFSLMLASAAVSFAQEADEANGQADLDAATALKLSAQSMADLERVIELCESAIEKGLETESEGLAKALLTATLFQHGSRFAQALFDPSERTQRPAMLKQFALRDLYKVLEYDDRLAQVHMMIARLESVNVGRGIRAESLEKGRASADKAIELLKEADDQPMLSKAYVLRAGYADTGAERMEFLNQAIAADPKNTDAWRLRGKSRLLQGELLSAAGQLEASKAVREQAIEDFSQLLEANPDDPDALQAVAELLGRLGNYEAALAKADEAIEQNPRVASLFLLRGRLHHETQKYEKAIQDLNRAIDLQPDSYIAFLDRAEVHYDMDDKSAAAKDYGRAREIQGQQITATVLQRITIRAEGKFDKAINEIEKYTELDDLNAEAEGRDSDPDYRLQLGQTFLVTNKHSKSIEVLSRALDQLGEKPRDRRLRGARFLGLRTRADAYLGIGKHAEAIADYEQALELEANENGALNNLAWVLATSPKDDVRDAEKAIQYATRACKVTDYKQAHILSTLAAAYAESGDFEKAMEWSSKAVELGNEDESTSPETLEQLKNELASYKQKKPWREIQQEEGKPLKPASNGDKGEVSDAPTREAPTTEDTEDAEDTEDTEDSEDLEDSEDSEE